MCTARPSALPATHAGDNKPADITTTALRLSRPWRGLCRSGVRRWSRGKGRERGSARTRGRGRRRRRGGRRCGRSPASVLVARVFNCRRIPGEPSPLVTGCDRQRRTTPGLIRRLHRLRPGTLRILYTAASGTHARGLPKNLGRPAWSAARDRSCRPDHSALLAHRDIAPKPSWTSARLSADGRSLLDAAERSWTVLGCLAHSIGVWGRTSTG